MYTKLYVRLLRFDYAIVNYMKAYFMIITYESPPNAFIHNLKLYLYIKIANAYFVELVNT